MKALAAVRSRIVDPVYVVQILFVVFALGWVLVLSAPECLMCLPTYAGFQPTTDRAWIVRMLLIAAIGLAGVMSSSVLVRAGAMAVTSGAWGYTSALFLFTPVWVTGDAMYPPLVGLAWWALIRLVRS